MTILSIVVPVYNEESSIKPFLERTEKVLDRIGEKYEIIFALDPSKDSTEEVILKEINRNNNIKLITFSRRFGQPSATIAGLHYSKGDYCVVIDVDLQDPPELIFEMYNKLNTDDQFDVVLAKRKKRAGETFIKKTISSLGYYLINKLTDVKIPRDTGDFRIMRKKVVEELKKLNETHGFLRGLISFIGYKQTFIEYDREKRNLGRGNYNRFFGSIKIGLNGLFSFTSKPLILLSTLGFIFSFLSFLLGAWYVIQKIFGVDLTPGLPTIVLVVTFFSGIQLLGIGLLGEYISRIYDEVKRRPQYIIDKKINFEE
tara:strand:- start:268 stop:1209 length:942 start_codon:yes stop_codon:yes gene_type:complete